MKWSSRVVICLALAVVACGKETTPTELPASLSPTLGPTPTPPPMSILGVTPREIPFGVTTKISAFGSGFTFPVQVYLHSGPCRLELIVESIGLTIVDSRATVPSTSCMPAGPADLEIVNPFTLRQASCTGCVSLK